MTIKYRFDKDLAFLEYSAEEDLKKLALILMYDSDGQPRRASELLKEPAFINLNGQPDQFRKSWQFIAGELQGFGGDSIVNFFRGNGVLYREIVSDVCDKQGIKYDKNASTYDIENQLIADCVKKTWTEMSGTEQKNFLHALNLKAESTLNTIQAKILQNELISYRSSAVLSAFMSYGFRDVLSKLSTTSLAKLGMTAVGARALAAVTIFGAAALTVPLITGSASRVTMPASLQVAYMRRKYEMEDTF